MAHAIRIAETGGPEVMEWVEVDVPSPAPTQARIRHSAVGLNFIDVYHRTGLYPLTAYPSGLGMEAAGVVDAVGDEVTGLAPGDRVAYAGVTPPGAYCELRNVEADRVVRIPDGVSDEMAAASLLKGMTAEYLLRRTFPVESGQTILIHAAAGGVGLIVCQWARHLGATVVGTVSTSEKAERARAHGCHHPVVVGQESFVERAREVTGGAGVDVVYDSVGKDTFESSLDCLRPLGMMVSFGQSSGPPGPLEVGTLGKKGSLFLTRPSLMTYNARREDLEASAAALFEVLGSGAVQAHIGQRFSLKNAADAHRALEGRQTTGSTVLLP